MGDPAAGPMVDNPNIGWLQNLLTQVTKCEHEMSTALDDAAAKLGAGNVWTSPPGTAAAIFASEVQGRQQQLRRIVGAWAGEVQAAISREPKQVPADQASQMRRERSMSRRFN